MDIKIRRAGDQILLASADYSLQIWTCDWHDSNKAWNDFAVWFFLPIAMRTGRDLRVEGKGSEETIKNARRISEIWESWLPHHFNSVNVSFHATSSRPRGETSKKRSLCFYSGGIDSTHALLTRYRAGEEQTLLTVHGMEYRADDADKFSAFKNKIAPFSRLVGNRHIFVRTNAYATYNKLKVNLPGAHFSHIFALAGSAFLFSESYNDILIAADYRLDQQFIAYPWGSNSATNAYFDDGSTRLSTLDDDLTRTDKVPLILSSEEALSSVTFCTSYQSRPDNCGRCQKCMRTKLMFLVSSGAVPKIFSDTSIPSDWYRKFDLKKRYQRAFLLDIMTCAKRNSRISQLPGANRVYSMLKEPVTSEGPKQNRMHKKIRKRATNILRNLKKKLVG